LIGGFNAATYFGGYTVGAVIGLVRPWPNRPVGLVLAFGAGGLISAVSFDLAQEGGATRDRA
jgi:ZIP family zinc transporter